MCGLCGELRFDGGLPDLAALSRMSARLARRGPDHAGSYSDGLLAFGHRRLSTARPRQGEACMWIGAALTGAR